MADLSPYSQICGKRAFLRGLGAWGLFAQLSRGQDRLPRPTISVGTFQDDYLTDAQNGGRRALFEGWVRYIKDRLRTAEIHKGLPTAKSPDEFVRKLALNSTSAQIAVLYAYDYLELKEGRRATYQPLLVPEWASGPQVKYGLYVRQEHEAQGLRDFQWAGRTISVEVGGRGLLPEILLRNELKRLNMEFENFATLRNEASSRRAVLPVFFGKGSGNTNYVDACFITETAFRRACQLNPRISTELRQIHVCKPVLSHVIACEDGVPEDVRREIVALSLGHDFMMGVDNAGFRFLKAEDHLLESISLERTYLLKNYEGFFSGRYSGYPAQGERRPHADRQASGPSLNHVEPIRSNISPKGK
jgi:hypothetical protein